MRALAVSGSVVVAGCASATTNLATAPTSTSAAMATPAGAAHALATLLMDRVVLPPGSRSVQNPGPVGPLSQPVMLPGNPNVVDVARFWVAPVTMDAAATFLESHPPSGLVSAGSGYGATRGVVDVRSVDNSDAVLPAGIQSAGVNLAIVLGPAAGTSMLRADAYAVWRPSRPADEQVGSRDVVVELTRQAGLQQQPTRSRTITDPAVVDRLSALFNALPTLVPGVRHCPADFGISYTAAFSPAVGRNADVTAVASGGCAIVTVTFAGKPSVPLEGGGFGEAIAALLGDTHPFQP